MTSKGDHKKHPKLARPTRGNYHRCEWAVYGTTCEKIEAFYRQVEVSLKPTYRLAYVDADHKDSVKGTRTQVNEKVISQSGTSDWNEYDDKSFTFDSDTVIVNGNHYPANQQIVFLDENKKDSLERRVEQLDNIRFLIKEQDDQEVYPFLQDRVTEETQVFLVEELDQLIAAIAEQIKESLPPLKALILAGGKSLRMGKDKSQVIYAGDLTQELNMALVTQKLGLETYISKAHDFESDEIDGIPVIKDRLLDMGPFGAIVSAMMSDPNSAWLVVACDLPFIGEHSLKQLVGQRYHSGIATAFKGNSRPFPEPLITIYEPRSYSRFLKFMSMGYSCPRKVIINSDVHIIELADELLICNVNTPEELERAKDSLKKHSAT